MQGLLEEGVRIEAAMPHPDPIRMARRIQNLGIARHLQGEDGIPALEKALGLFESIYGEDHRQTAGALSEAGILYRAQGRHEEGRIVCGGALRIHEREYGSDSPEATRDLHNLAGSHEESGDIEAAAALYERAMELKDRAVGGDQEELGEMQFSVARLYIEWGIFARPGADVDVHRDVQAEEGSPACKWLTKRRRTSRNIRGAIRTRCWNWGARPRLGIMRAGAHGGAGDEYGISGQPARPTEKEGFRELAARKGGGGARGGQPT